MIVSRGRRYIFVHAPKTGGTALALALERRAMKDDILIGDTPKARRRRGRQAGLTAAGRLWKHSRLSDIEGLVSPAEIDDFLVFTLVRNPWDRMLSYHAWLRVQRFDHPAVRLARSSGFAEFLRHPGTRAALAAERYGAYVAGGDGREREAIFVRLEHLDEDLGPVEAHLGFSLAPLPHVNRSERPADYRAAYSDADAEIVAALCAEDIRRFGYRF